MINKVKEQSNRTGIHNAVGATSSSFFKQGTSRAQILYEVFVGEAN